MKENSFSFYSVFLCKQLVHLSTRSLVHLPCYPVFHLPCLQATCSLVHSFTCPLTMLPCLLFTLSTSNLLTRLLVHLSTYLLVYFSTKKLLYLAFSINFAIFANCLIHMYHMFVEINDISYYEFKLQSLCMEGSRRVLFVLLYDRERVSQSDLIISD